MNLQDVNELFKVDLCRPEFAEAYLNDILHKEEMPVFLIALRNVARTQEGIGAISEATGLGRESLYKTLSPSGNPHFETVIKVLAALGYRLSVERISAKQCDERNDRVASELLVVSAGA